MLETAPIHAVIFDMDGVLADSEPLINEAAIRMFAERGLKVQPEDFLPFIGAGEDRYIAGVAEKYNFSLDLIAAKKRTYEIYLELVPDRLNAFRGAVNLVQTCRAAGLKVAVASSADRVKIDANLKKIGLPPDAWHAIVSAEDALHKKPAPDIFLAAARKLQLSPSECVVIEDAVNGVQAAKAAGMRCIAVAQTFAPEKLHEADLIKAKISELSVRELTGKADEAIQSLPPMLGSASSCDAKQAPSEPPRKPWGFWATIGLSCVIGAGVVLLQIILGIAIVVFASFFHFKKDPQEMAASGLFLALATCASAPVAIGLACLFARLRRSIPVTEYLGLKLVPGRTLLRWGLVLGLFSAVSDGVTSLLGRPIVPEFMSDAYRTAEFLPLLWLAVIVAAPAGEEILFRGFLFQGVAHSKLGGSGAIVFTALIWAAIHMQYDLYGVGTIFFAGLLLGFVRLKTGSVYATIFLHALMNLIATIQVAVLERMIRV